MWGNLSAAPKIANGIPRDTYGLRLRGGPLTRTHPPSPYEEARVAPGVLTMLSTSYSKSWNSSSLMSTSVFEFVRATAASHSLKAFR